MSKRLFALNIATYNSTPHTGTKLDPKKLLMRCLKASSKCFGGRLSICTYVCALAFCKKGILCQKIWISFRGKTFTNLSRKMSDLKVPFNRSSRKYVWYVIMGPNKKRHKKRQNKRVSASNSSMLHDALSWGKTS